MRQAPSIQAAEKAFGIRPIMRHIDPTEHDEPPHRHDFQELIWISAGTGRQQIDQKIIDIAPQTFYLISRGQVHYFHHGENLDGYVVSFTDDFLRASSGDLGWDYRMTLLSHFAIHNSLTLDEGMAADCVGILRRMRREYEGGGFGRETALRHLLSLLLLQLERVRQRVEVESAELSQDAQLFQTFLTNLEQSFRHNHHVSHYASQLHVTPRRLSTVVARYSGKTAKKLIHERILLEARRYLQHTNASVKEIAFALGFADASYFSKVFKQGMGVSPHTFKAEL